LSISHDALLHGPITAEQLGQIRQLVPAMPALAVLAAALGNAQKLIEAYQEEYGRPSEVPESARTMRALLRIRDEARSNMACDETTALMIAFLVGRATKQGQSQSAKRARDSRHQRDREAKQWALDRFARGTWRSKDEAAEALHKQLEQIPEFRGVAKVDTVRNWLKRAK
jgi:hypothetical protein